MKLNLKTDYALRVLIFLQRKEKATIREVAEYYDVKKNHLSVVVNKLSELGYIDSSPGPKGGISLKAKTLEKSIAEIILEFEDFDLVECFNSDSSSCRLDPTCKLKSILKKANKQFINELKKYKVKDIQQAI